MNKHKFFQKSNIIYFVFFLAVTATVYWKLIYHFFEQDEWMGMGHIFAYGLGTVTEGGKWYEILMFGAGRPIATLVNYIFYTLFRFNTLPLAIFSIMLQGVTMYFVFLLLKKFGSKTKISLMAVLFFGINATSNQAITWFSSLAVVLSSLFLTVSMIFFVDFIKKQDERRLFLSYLLFYLSFLTKEINVLFSIFFLGYYYIYGNRNIKKTLQIGFPFLLITTLAFSRYFLSYFLSSRQVGLIINSSDSGLQLLLKNFILTPLTSLGQIFIAPEHLYLYGRRILVLLQGIDPGDLFVQTTMATCFSVAISVFLITILILFYKRNMLSRKNLFAGLLIYFLAILPYVVIKGGGSAYLEGRYYYLAVLGVSIIFAGLKGFGKFGNYKYLLFLLFLLYLVVQFRAIESNLDRKIEISGERSALVRELSKINLKDNKRNIFFASSTKEYLGQKLPFQQGVGYTLMVIFYPQGIVPRSFLADNYLWNIGAQGYFENKEGAFGYFSEEEVLNETLKSLNKERFNLVLLEYENGKLLIETENVGEQI